ncbi:metalloendopeptidase-like membrane protein [Burkholderiales bacterium JOSHI_001]|nr:metalloendopeptidase-like membrane protein [Burkholderiales bacterium JOSHI_001]
MQIMITHSSLLSTRVLNFSRWQIAGALLGLAAALMLFSGAVYHFVFLKAARDGWPVVSQIVKLIVRDEIAQRDRFMRENLDAMAQRVGEMQAKLVKMEAVGERVSGLAGIKPEELALPTSPGASKPAAAAPGGQGGPFVPLNRPTLDELNQAINQMEERTEHGTDLFTMVESRLFETRLQSLLVPSSVPVADVQVGSGFGFRHDPFTGRAALHTGLDFPTATGTPIQAAAGGVVLSTDYHHAYGNLLEIDHGNGLVTRYAHTSKIGVKVGDLVKRGQVVAEVGSTGRSTGPHLHFEVLLDSVPQNPARFLAGLSARR